MENLNDNDENVIDSEVFLRELNLNDEERSILAKVIAVLATDYAASVISAILQSIFGETANDETNKALIQSIVTQYGNANTDTLAEAIYDIMKGEDGDGNTDRK